MPTEDIVIRTGKPPLPLWSTIAGGAFVSAIWSVGAGLLGLLAAMLVTLRGISGMEGFAHLVFLVPMSSALVGLMLWLIAWVVVLILSPAAFEPETIVRIRWMACGLVFIFQAALWVILTKSCAQ